MLVHDAERPVERAFATVSLGREHAVVGGGGGVGPAARTLMLHYHIPATT